MSAHKAADALRGDWMLYRVGVSGEEQMGAAIDDAAQVIERLDRRLGEAIEALRPLAGQVDITPVLRAMEVLR